MQLSLILATLAATAFAAPHASDIEARATCYHPSTCSTSWSGKCEAYCGSRGFSHMTGSGCTNPPFVTVNKKCCCKKS